MSSTQGPNVYSLIITLFGSVLASYITTELLFDITNHAELWVTFIGQVILLLMVSVAIYNYLYSERYKGSLWWQSRQNYIVFIQMTFILTFLRLVTEFVTDEIDTNRMRLTDAFNLFNFAAFTVFVLMMKVQILFD